jgi:hypothetical protein
LKNEFYNELISDLPFAYSYQKMIYDDKGVPKDFEIIEVNKTFEQLTSIEASASSLSW